MIIIILLILTILLSNSFIVKYTVILILISMYINRNIIYSNSTITLVGDVMIGRSFNERNDHKIFSDQIKEHLKKSDLFIFNLETTLTDSNDKYPDKVFNYKLSPKYAHKIIGGLSRKMYASINNNHIYDYMDKGIDDTKRSLDNLGIIYNDKGSKLVTIDIGNNTIIGLLSAADHYEYWKHKIWYINPKNVINDDDDILKTILNNSKARCDILIFSSHMQSNYVDEIDNYIQLFYRYLIDNGVDIIHGHSPHHIQKIEKYKNGYICYSLGDFIDDYAISHKYNSNIGLLVDFKIVNKKIVGYKKHMTKINNMSVDFFYI